MARLEDLTKAQGCGIVLAILVLAIASLALGGWVLMVAWGAVASIFDWPTASYIQSIGAYFFLSIIGGLFKRGVS